MPSVESPRPRLTPRGAATRARIVDAAADLFYEKGVVRTGNEDLRRTAGVSGSQLNHFFPDRRHLVRAVLERRAEDAADGARLPGLGGPATLAALDAWAGRFVREADERRNGCRVGSLVAEGLRVGALDPEDASGAFGRWADALTRAVAALKEAGELSPEADPRRLALGLLGSLQGGLLLLQATGDPVALRASLDAGLALVHAYAAPAMTG